MGLLSEPKRRVALRECAGPREADEEHRDDKN